MSKATWRGYCQRFRCTECRSVTTVTRRDLAKAARPRCSSCGSLALDPLEESRAARRVVGGRTRLYGFEDEDP